MPYVAGATEVFLSGVLSKFDPALGVATIGSIQVYVPNAFVENSTPMIVGASISVLGYQAGPRQQIWATQIGSEQQSARDAGNQSIQGTGVTSLSIQGTGKQSIQSAGASNQSIQGTGVTSLSIQGTGKQSIQGNGVRSLSIQGTG
jgi:hypothetical protein